MPEWLATALIAAVIVVIGVLSAVSYVRRLSQGCCGGGTGKERRIEAAQGEYPHRYIVHISGMTCPKCAQCIENGFNRQQGMKAAVDLKKAEALVCTEKPASEIIIRKTISDLGYSTVDITAAD